MSDKLFKQSIKIQTNPTTPPGIDFKASYAILVKAVLRNHPAGLEPQEQEGNSHE